MGMQSHRLADHIGDFMEFSIVHADRVSQECVFAQVLVHRRHSGLRDPE